MDHYDIEMTKDVIWHVCGMPLIVHNSARNTLQYFIVEIEISIPHFISVVEIVLISQ